jgi:hypothetical protein
VYNQGSKLKIDTLPTDPIGIEKVEFCKEKGREMTAFAHGGIEKLAPWSPKPISGKPR